MNKHIIKRITLLAVLLTMTVCLAAGADNVTIDTSEGMPFMYGGNSYLPLQDVANFLGAQLSWDPEQSQTVMSYLGKDLALKPNSLNARFEGQPVVLPAETVVIDGRTYVPADTLRKYYAVPMEWDKARSDVRIKGRSNWGTMNVKSRPPWHGGPPPWAPAWGERGKPGVHHPQRNNGHHKGELKNKSKAKFKSMTSMAIC